MPSFVYRFTAVCLALFAVWAAAAIYIDCRISALKLPLSAGFVFLTLTLFVLAPRSGRWLLLNFLLSATVLFWWLSLKPSNSRDWQADVSHMPEAVITADHLAISNIRNCAYRTETDYTCAWETRDYLLTDVRAVDLFITHWGAPLIAHVIVSFDFGDNCHLAFSIEARKQKGQDYSALLGFFRQYGLIYLAADERDVIRLRTDFRRGEFVYLYRTQTTVADARRLLLAYCRWMNETKADPRWYNALTENCNRSVIRFLADAHIGGITWWDWRGFLNGRGDQMLYELGDLVTDGLSFPDLKRQALINQMAAHAVRETDFSRQIRQGRAGFH